MSTRKLAHDARTLGQAIREARKEIGMSQKDLAKQLRVSDKTISSYEVGRASPGFGTLTKMSRIVNKPISYFDTDAASDDIDLQIKLRTIERELLEIKKLLSKKE
jgi:transcriptional regulator with XRE-family HTH domain